MGDLGGGVLFRLVTRLVSPSVDVTLLLVQRREGGGVHYPFL